MGNDLPKEPVVFFKPVSSLIGPGDAIVLPPESTLVEHEAEIAIVIGRRLRRGNLAEAERAIRGFTCANDVTARDLQKKDAQWGRAKGYDTFCPVLPTVAEGLDWRNLEVIGRVNGTGEAARAVGGHDLPDSGPARLRQRGHDPRAGRPGAHRIAGWNWSAPCTGT